MEIQLDRISPIWLSNHELAAERQGITCRSLLYKTMQESMDEIAERIGDRSLDLVVKAYYYGKPKNVLLIYVDNDCYMISPTIAELSDS